MAATCRAGGRSPAAGAAGRRGRTRASAAAGTCAVARAADLGEYSAARWLLERMSRRGATAPGRGGNGRNPVEPVRLNPPSRGSQTDLTRWMRVSNVLDVA